MVSTEEIRTLVVDDSAPMREAIADVLRDVCGCNIVGEGANGLEALELARTHNPDMIVMDLQMPLMGGLEAMRLLKAELPRTHIVLVSSILDHEVRQYAMGLGATACLQKGTDLWNGLQTIAGELSQVSQAISTRASISTEF